VIVDPVEIRECAEARREENLGFCRYLHGHHRPIEELQEIATQVERDIDCTACANCCRQTVVSVGQPEIEAIASYLGIDPDLAARQYTRPDPEDSQARVLENEHDACVFLDENLCMIYDVRPKACRDFPHVTPHCHTLGGRLSSLCRKAAICPIVFNAFEQYKERLGYR
jgi:Fe-S-cluster containining protein